MACVNSCVTPEARSAYQGGVCDIILASKAKYLHGEDIAETLDLGSHAKRGAQSTSSS